jgi:hypothetical protein
VLLLMPSELEILQFRALVRCATIRSVAESLVSLHKNLPLMILRMRAQSQALKVLQYTHGGLEFVGHESQKVTAY